MLLEDINAIRLAVALKNLEQICNTLIAGQARQELEELIEDLENSKYGEFLCAKTFEHVMQLVTEGDYED